MTTYGKYTKSEIDRNVTKAKKEWKQEQIQDGMCYCWTCGKGGILQCSHTIGTNDCQKCGHAEWAWDWSNFWNECQRCHVNWGGSDYPISVAVERFDRLEFDLEASENCLSSKYKLC